MGCNIGWCVLALVTVNTDLFCGQALCRYHAWEEEWWCCSCYLQIINGSHICIIQRWSKLILSSVFRSDYIFFIETYNAQTESYEKGLSQLRLPDYNWCYILLSHQTPSGRWNHFPFKTTIKIKWDLKKLLQHNINYI